MTKRVWRLGIIGCGGFSRLGMEAVATLPDVTVTAVADPVAEHAQATLTVWQAARRAAAAVGAGNGAGTGADSEAAPGWAAAADQPAPAVHADYRDLLARPDVDAVWVLTPPYLHHPVGRDVLLAGKHLFLEKPGSLTAEQAEDLARLAAARGLAASVDFVMRRNPIYRFLHRLTAAGALGHLEQISLENHAHDDHMPPSHWFWDEARSGGIWVEHGVHFFDLVEWLAGPPAAITAVAVDRPVGTVPPASIRDAVAALAVHPAPRPDAQPVVVTYYHAFVRPGPFERTTLRLAFQRAYVEVRGWIAVRLEADALVTEGEADLFTGHAWLRPTFTEIYPGGRTFTGRGRMFNAMGRLRLEGDLGDRWQVYRQAVCDGIRDLLRAAADPGHRPEVDLGHAGAALRAAAAATASQRGGAATTVPSGAFR